MTDRRKILGDRGEQIAQELLRENGFEKIRNLNDIYPNHRFGDFLAERDGRRYLISVKTRNACTQAGSLNPAYNLQKRTEDVNALCELYLAEPAWITIQIFADTGRCNAFFGTIAELDSPFSVPMTKKATAKYECLAKDRFDPRIIPDLSNQL